MRSTASVGVTRADEARGRLLVIELVCQPAEAKQGVDDPRELARLADELDDEQAASRFICTGDPDEAVERIEPYLDLGFRHLVFHSPANDQRAFLERFSAEIAPACGRCRPEGHRG